MSVAATSPSRVARPDKAGQADRHAEERPGQVLGLENRTANRTMGEALHSHVFIQPTYWLPFLQVTKVCQKRLTKSEQLSMQQISGSTYIFFPNTGYSTAFVIGTF